MIIVLESTHFTKEISSPNSQLKYAPTAIIVLIRKLILKSTSNNLKTRNADKEEIKPVKRVPEVVAGRRSSKESSETETWSSVVVHRRKAATETEKWSPDVGGTQRDRNGELVAFALEWSSSPMHRSAGVAAELKHPNFFLNRLSTNRIEGWITTKSSFHLLHYFKRFKSSRHEKYYLEHMAQYRASECWSSGGASEMGLGGAEVTGNGVAGRINQREIFEKLIDSKLERGLGSKLTNFDFENEKVDYHFETEVACVITRESLLPDDSEVLAYENPVPTLEALKSYLGCVWHATGVIFIPNLRTHLSERKNHQVFPEKMMAAVVEKVPGVVVCVLVGMAKIPITDGYPIPKSELTGGVN
ncbi:hypothetical protein LXL04_010881 [Taraxacum kok-saghyz]